MTNSVLVAWLQVPRVKIFFKNFMRLFSYIAQFREGAIEEDDEKLLKIMSNYGMCSVLYIYSLLELLSIQLSLDVIGYRPELKKKKNDITSLNR